jgi:hypothetical protein
MATREEVDQFVAKAVSEHVKSALDGPTKDALGGLMDWYESSGYSTESLAQSLDQLIPKDLHEASAEEVAKAVGDLSTPQAEAGSEHADHVSEQAASQSAEGSGRQPSAELPDEDVLKDLGEQLAWDAVAEIDANKAALTEDIVRTLWDDVRKQLMAEIKEQLAAEDGGGWESDDQLKAALYEPAYNAVVAAIDELFKTGAQEGGFEALLSRRSQ